MTITNKILSFLGRGADISKEKITISDVELGVFREIYKDALYDRILKTLYDKTIFEDNKNKIEIDKIKKTFFDNPLKTELNKGLFHHVKEAMIGSKSLNLEYDKKGETIKVIDDTKEVKEEKFKVYFSFEYLKSLNTMLDFYLEMLYNLIRSINYKVVSSRSLIVKIDGMTDNIATSQIDGINTQIKSIASAINEGDIGVIDSKGQLEKGIIDVSGIAETQETIMRQISQLLKFSVNFLTGESTSGIGTTGENDQEKDFKSLSVCFNEYWKPIIEQLYNIKISLKIDKWQLSAEHKSFLDWVETNSLISEEIKRKITSKILLSDGLIEEKLEESKDKKTIEKGGKNERF